MSQGHDGANGTQPGPHGRPPKPPCKLVGEDGNVFIVIGLVRRALLKAGQEAAAKEFVQRAFKARSYDEVLTLCMEFVDVR